VNLYKVILEDGDIKYVTTNLSLDNVYAELRKMYGTVDIEYLGTTINITRF